MILPRAWLHRLAFGECRPLTPGPLPGGDGSRDAGEENVMSEKKVVRAVCPHDCPDTCSMLITVEDGHAVKLRGDPDHPFTDGYLCQKVTRYLERVYHP